MKPKAYKAYRKRCRNYLNTWIPLLSLQDYRIRVNYYDDSADFPGASDYSEGIMLARVSCQWEYLDVTIAVNVPAIARLSEEEIEETIVHELCHIIVNEMSSECVERKHEERVVTNMARTFLRLRNMGKQKVED